MDVGMPVCQFSECLYRGDHAGNHVVPLENSLKDIFDYVPAKLGKLF
jgi:hypothetical protein